MLWRKITSSRLISLISLVISRSSQAISYLVSLALVTKPQRMIATYDLGNARAKKITHQLLEQRCLDGKTF